MSHPQQIFSSSADYFGSAPWAAFQGHKSWNPPVNSNYADGKVHPPPNAKPWHPTSSPDDSDTVCQIQSPDPFSCWSCSFPFTQQ
ncbi:hypothetical protein AVEN_179631-1 [Araneus ventricosus]|uniref:Uncharacterized protein n=1 Tax=Araneus ventricosus TaxID=182803 RepID=A0A4Y2BCX8_ARAVE|nr:hypothetical protein AVEN_179631-1 [Araneus ventricosus]